MSAVRRELTQTQWLEAVGIDPFWIVDAAPVPERATAESAPRKQANTADGESLDQRIQSCKSCGLARGRKQAIPGSGDLQADWLLVGEPPGADEDKAGLPFVGQSGKLLDAMLAALGLKRDKGVYLTHVVKCHPGEDRTLESAEVDACNHFLDQQIARIQPKVILAMGRSAAYAVLERDALIQSMRGTVHYRQQGDQQIPVIVTYPPAYLLKEPAEKWKAWQDLVLAKKSLNA